MVTKMREGWYKESERHVLAKKGICTNKYNFPTNLTIKTKNIEFKVIIKSKHQMKDYIALHGLVPDYELPNSMDGRIPIDEVWIREDVYQDKDWFNQVLWHETEELKLMTQQGTHYKKAHLIVTEQEINKFGCSGVRWIQKPYKTRSQIELERLEQWERAKENENIQDFSSKEQPIHVDYKQERAIQEEKRQKVKEKEMRERKFWRQPTKKVEVKKTNKKLELKDFL
jgi:hypothetical protein